MHFCEDHLQRHCRLKDPCRTVPIRRKSRLLPMRLYRIRRSPSDWTAQARRSHSRRMVVRRVLPNRPDPRVNQSVLVAGDECRENARSLSANKKYTTGNTNIVRRVAEINPPITTTARGFWVSDPMP